MAAQQELLHRLIEIGALQIGEYRLKGGSTSPIYVDLRNIIGYPDILQSIVEVVHSKYSTLDAELVCGVPYTALPIATLYSVLYKIPMILKRKEAKDYGTKRMLEGVKKSRQRCLIIEDVVSSGTSVLETASVLRNHGLVVEDCIVILDREQGGRENLADAGIRLHSLFNLVDFFMKYTCVKLVETGVVKAVTEYIERIKYLPVKKPEELRLEFAEKAKRCDQPVARRLLEIVARKKSNLCVAADCTKSSDLLDLAEKVGPFICMLKTHIDILTDFEERVVEELSVLAKKHDFVLFEDRKFADIGNTVKNQYEQGMYKIHQWADIVTVHAIPGGGIIDALKSAGKERACILIAEMSSEGTLTNDSYQKKVCEMADGHLDFVIGFVSQKKISDKNSLIHFCPGVHIGCSGDSLGQQYKSPEEAVDNGADVIIVGRGISSADDVVQAAKEYQKRGFDAYMKKVST